MIASSHLTYTFLPVKGKNQLRMSVRLSAPSRRAALAAAIPVLTFLVALAATYAYERRGSSEETDGARLVISLQIEASLPTAAITEVGLDGSSPRRLTAAPSGVASASDFQPDWSDASGQLVFARETFAEDGTGSVPKLYVQSGDTQPRRVTDGTDVDRYPAWSPDGRSIAFSRDTNGAFELFVVAADGSNLRQLTRDPSRLEEFPAWSPDGRRLAFASTAGENGDLRLMNADGTGVVSLTEGSENDNAPSWSPDGSKLVFVRDGSIFVIGADGSSPQQLTTGSTAYSEPSWSPDGTRIAFTDEEAGRLFVISSDGPGLTGVPVEGAVLPGVAWKNT
jgi:dipeptidyl aminopeptidase/acylaminoacyl peptidase